MPWTKDDIEKFNKGLTDDQKDKWLAIANSAYESCIKDGGSDESCAASAIKQANGAVKNERFEPPESGEAPAEVKEILKGAYNSCRTDWTKDHPDDRENADNKESCSKIAWAAVYKAGWSKDTDGNWNKRAEEKPELETRNYEEIRIIGKTRLIEGYAIVFNTRSKDLGGFHEVILPSAMDGMIERSDVLALINHDLSKGVLARSTNGQGSLELEIDKHGVLYRFTAPETALGNELIEGIKRGDIRTSSFAFTVDRDGQEWDTSVKPAIRTVKKFKGLYDVSAVYREAYENTSVALRSLDELNNANPIPEIKPDVAKTIPEPIIKEKRKLSIREENLRRANDEFKKGNYLNIKHYFR
jgi:HK97 family phage prohead protease